MSKRPRKYRLNEQIKTITLTSKRKGASQPEVRSVQVVVRSSKPITRTDWSDLLAQAIEAERKPEIGHDAHPHRKIERK